MTDDEPQTGTASDRLPIMATTHFCDDLRIEATGKLLLVGCYPGSLILLNSAAPIDRLWVVTKILWPRGFDVTDMRMRIDVPAQEPGFVPVAPVSSDTASAMLTATCAWQLRFPPLRPGDVIRVRVECGGGTVNCGELAAAAAPSPPRSTRH